MHFRILVLKLYLQSNTEKGTSSHCVLGEWRWYIHENINLLSMS